MNKRKKSNALSPEAALVKAHVTKNRCRAQFVGIVYLFALLVLAATACLPFFDLGKQENAPVGLLTFWKVFQRSNWGTARYWSGFLKFVNAGLYAVMLLILFINVLKAFGKLGWLYKKKVSKTYGLNRNVYAMEDLGKLFSTSFAIVFGVYYLMAVLCGQAYFNLLMYLVLAFCIVVHLFAGFIGGKASYFNVADGKITEDARTVSRFPALVRNVLQIASIIVMAYLFLKVSVIHTVCGPMLQKDSIAKYVVNRRSAFVAIFFQVVALACFVPLVFHATATTEYNIDGAYGRGMKTFRIFVFFLCLAMAAAAGAQYYFGQVVFTLVDGATVVDIAKALNYEAITIAAIAFVMFMIELIMRNAPGHKQNKSSGKNCGCGNSDSSVVVYIYNN